MQLCHASAQDSGSVEPNTKKTRVRRPGFLRLERVMRFELTTLTFGKVMLYP